MGIILIESCFCKFQSASGCPFGPSLSPPVTRASPQPPPQIGSVRGSLPGAHTSRRVGKRAPLGRIPAGLGSRRESAPRRGGSGLTHHPVLLSLSRRWASSTATAAATAFAAAGGTALLVGPERPGPRGGGASEKVGRVPVGILPLPPPDLEFSAPTAAPRG